MTILDIIMYAFIIYGLAYFIIKRLNKMEIEEGIKKSRQNYENEKINLAKQKLLKTRIFVDGKKINEFWVNLYYPQYYDDKSTTWKFFYEYSNSYNSYGCGGNFYTISFFRENEARSWLKGPEIINI
jgi:hypothetical protein